MRRRLVVAITGAVAAAVVVVGAGTLVLTTLDARRIHEEDLSRRVGELAEVLDDLRPVRGAPVAERLEASLDVDTLQVVPLDPAPELLDEDEVTAVLAGDTVSRRDGTTAIVAAPLAARGAFPARALVATDGYESTTNPAFRWFLLAGVFTIGLGALVALRLAGSLTGPLVQAERATRSIARGEPTPPLPEPMGPDDALARLLRSINTMASALDQSRRAEQDFLLSISHDLRTPLTSIGGWAEALADGAAPDPKAAGRTILVESRRLERLVRDLLDLARVRARAFTLEVRPVDLRDVAMGVGEGLRPDLDDAALTLEVDVPAEPVTVEGDADRLAQIAGNLVENAAQHTATTVRVTVTAGEGDVAVLSVEDDGPGIVPADRHRVFEPLYSRRTPAQRASPARRGSGSGTGLGLATSRALAEAMGGSVHVADTPLGGACLVVRLPLR